MNKTKLMACLLLASASAFAADKPTDAYVVDSKGVVVRTDFGLCVRTSEWSKEKAIKECDPDLFPAEEKKVMPPEHKTSGGGVSPVTPPEQLKFNANTLFDFDKAVVKPEGKKALDKFAEELKGMKFDAISVTGHTDRIGTEKYNMHLSDLRAAAVKAYLVESAKIEPTKIFTAGKGESDPVTKPGDCRHMSKKATIACLQPDRRVVVEVSASRQ